MHKNKDTISFFLLKSISEIVIAVYRKNPAAFPHTRWATNNSMVAIK